MKVKVGQYVRVAYGCIFKIETCNKYKFGGYTLNGVYWDDYNENIVAIANTPQELVQVGDDVTVYSLDNLKRKFEVIGFGMDGTIFTNGKNSFGIDYGTLEVEQVVEIWTKVNEDTYKRQWRKQ